MSDAAQTLAKTLGAPLPEEFDQLTEADLAALDGLLRSALAGRAARLESATETSLQLIPRLMRPAVKKVLGL
ncbi:hypothetical protein [Nocardia sp. XZ_19_385]|uniref:hypothetical protein n=1 Tax=Nocardia sp. XZ_19_385 TaxID=2769488 RepID=UPI00188E02EE|nr:hypothetical protein [Nocardia sp. XZ_19_385]